MIFSKFFKIFGHFLAIFRVRFSLIFIDKNMRLIFTFLHFSLIFIDFSQKVGFWSNLDLGPKNGPKMGPKWVQNGPKKGRFTLIFMALNMRVKWTKMGPKWVQNGSKRGQKLASYLYKGFGPYIRPGLGLYKGPI